ncbi:MAG: DUF6624 domain-containing protein [Psychroserpens sp.]|uniref:DUF6624 domain-containing protein n=1 Tax=Psychroserpens sp. TaxID=2020870 RepID=UPI003C7803FB
MNRLVSFLVVVFLCLACKQVNDKDDVEQSETAYNQTLANELSKIYVIDQLAASNAYPPDDYQHLSQEEWVSFKDSIFTTHQKRAKQMLNTYGFVGRDLAGEEGSRAFWIIAQHSDHNPKFQLEVLEKMKIEVENDNADSRLYGLLTDRVNLNRGQAQIYGTQVKYNMEICQAFPKQLADSSKVNKRRKEIGLEPLEVYLNDMTTMHFEMNKEYYSKKGITEPKLNKIK